jgi:hypothetical protein
LSGRSGGYKVGGKKNVQVIQFNGMAAIGL